MKIELLPENWTFCIGRQNTVRKGPKWADKLIPGQRITFECSDGRYMVAGVKRVTKTHFFELSDKECEANHAYGGRAEFKDALLRAYGEFEDSDLVSLIEFAAVSEAQEPK